MSARARNAAINKVQAAGGLVPSWRDSIVPAAVNFTVGRGVYRHRLPFNAFPLLG